MHRIFSHRLFCEGFSYAGPEMQKCAQSKLLNVQERFAMKEIFFHAPRVACGGHYDQNQCNSLVLAECTPIIGKHLLEPLGRCVQ